jgi:hypothetical protein
MHFESDSDDTSYPAVLDTDIGIINLNAAVETLVSKIEQDCDFPFDDENFANIAEGTIDLEEGVSKYTITDRFRHILEIKVKDIDGNYHIVEPVFQEEDSNIVETEEALTGLPTKYRMVGRTIFLRVSPTATSVTLTAGLLFKYTRTSYQITTADVTAGSLILGIDTAFHTTVAKMAALPYCATYKKDRVARLERDILIETNDCIKLYANRLKGKRKIISGKKISYI